MSDDVEQKTDEVYKKYYSKKGKDRNNLLRNPEVLFQTLAFDRSVISALSSLNVDPVCAKVLDVGCGGGGSFINLLKCGFLPENFTGIDILEERILKAKRQFSNVNFVLGDASKMQFQDETFDIVTESTMFTQLTDDSLAHSITGEMVRVTKTGGYILLVDWRYSKPWDKKHYKGLSIGRIKELFDVGSKASIFKIYRGALVPPVGRFISKNIPSIYFVLQSVFPFLVGQMVTVLRKN